MQSGLVPPREAGPRAMEAASKAVELDDSLAEAHLRMAILRTWYEWDWEGGEAEFHRAIELNPNYAEARVFYSNFLTMLGRPEEGAAQIERALELDPLNPFFQGLYGAQLFIADRYDDAIAQLRKTFSMAPGFGFGHHVLSFALHHQGMYEEAMAETMADFATRGDTEVVGALERGYAEAGYEAAMRSAAEILVARSRTAYVPSIRIANLFVRAGDKEKALEWLEKAFEAHDPHMPYIVARFWSDILRDDPRFQDLLGRMNLPTRLRKSAAAHAGAA